MDCQAHVHMCCDGCQMNPLAHYLALEACREIVQAVDQQNRKMSLEAVRSARAALQCERVSPNVFHLCSEEPATHKWFVMDGLTFDCCFEAEAYAEQHVQNPWKVISFIGLEGPIS